MRDLGTLGGDFSVALGVNDAGQVIGWSDTAGNAARHAFIWDATNGMRDLGTLGGTNSNVVAINANGQVIGVADTANADTRGFIWNDSNGMRDLGSDTQPFAINAAGQVVGSANSHAFFWDDRNGLVDMGTLGGASSRATHINDNGQVIGTAETRAKRNQASETHAFIWNANARRSHMRDLGTLGGSFSSPNAINTAGQVIGIAFTSNGDTHGFVWDRSHDMRDLGTLGGTRAEAIALNDAGQIAGMADTTGDAANHAFFVEVTPPGNNRR